jgi:mRNA interferase MazF
MTLKLGEIVLVRMHFHQAAGTKVRPAAVLLDTGDDDFVAAPVTSAPGRSEFDIAIEDWRQAGLNVASTIRVHKLTVLSKPEILRTVGTLTERDRKSLGTALYHAFGRG